MPPDMSWITFFGPSRTFRARFPFRLGELRLPITGPQILSQVPPQSWRQTDAFLELPPPPVSPTDKAPTARLGRPVTTLEGSASGSAALNDACRTVIDLVFKAQGSIAVEVPRTQCQEALSEDVPAAARDVGDGGREPNGGQDQSSIVPVFEHAANALSFVPKPGRSSHLRDDCPQSLKVIGGQVDYEPVYSEYIDEPSASGEIFNPRALGDFARVARVVPVGHVPSAKLAHIQSASFRARRSPRVEVVFLIE
jgi:hypothetical protein